MKKLILFSILLTLLPLLSYSQERVKKTVLGVGDVTSFSNMKERFSPKFVKIKGESVENLYDEVSYKGKYVTLTNYYGIPQRCADCSIYDLEIIQIDRIVKRRNIVGEKKRRSGRTEEVVDGYSID